jgi:hypothetical protein
MAKTGFRIDVRKMRTKLNGLANLRADEFRDDVMDYTRKTLTTAVRETPVREYSVIRENQIAQYNLYVNFIPDCHRLIDPSLRINGRQHWLFFRGKWYNASDWKLSPEAFDAYQSLLSEHNRRANIAKSTFIKNRAQARFLYRKTWTEAADSLGMQVTTTANVRNSVTRRKPKVFPPKSYGQTHGGGTAFSVTISTPFLTAKPRSKYQTFDPADIMASAQAKHIRQFERTIKRKMRKLAKTK